MTEEIKITNPYTERKMIPTGSEMFFGREQEMQRMPGTALKELTHRAVQSNPVLRLLSIRKSKLLDKN